MAYPGYPVTEPELRALGFEPLELRIDPGEEALPDGPGSKWTTLGEVPAGPGLYAFSVEEGDDVRIAYVGLTEHLWMVTKGRLPGGGSRPAQRYGRPKYAGTTRQRVNAEITAQLRQGRDVRHWVRPMSDPPHERDELRNRLGVEEEEFIQRWDLRRLGWNRG